MSMISSHPYPTRELAEQAAQQLVQKGVPAAYISVRDDTPPVGLNLGAGVPAEAINAIISEHDGEGSAESSLGGYIVDVDTQGDVLNESATREVFGSIA